MTAEDTMTAVDSKTPPMTMFRPGPVVPVHVTSTDMTIRVRASRLLDRAGIPLSPEPGSDTVLVATGRTVDDALNACAGPVSMIIADMFTPPGVLRAVRAGVKVLLQFDKTTPEQLAAAVLAARNGDGRMPHDVLVRLLGGQPQPAPPLTPLTARQTAVLSLTADGHGNAAIARSLSCSEHTVKNVIYDLMARLQVRNRAHAVAQAVRAGLI
jgi:DNA-binding NarL/FixJ family response regulator